jgi:hypothetical protein
VRLWHTFQRRLRRAGVTVTPAMGPLELAAVAGGQMTQQREKVDHIADLYLRLRYASDGPQLDQLRRAVRDFRIPRK